MTLFPQKLRSSRPRVLLVEDYPALVVMISILLQDNLKADVVVAGSLTEALQSMAANPDFALVLVDLGLPDSAPEETIEELGKLKPSNGRLVVISGTVVDRQKAEAAARMSGADGWIDKVDPKMSDQICAWARRPATQPPFGTHRP